MSYPKVISICIPSYNRPNELKRLLESIDCEENQIEIIICEDNAPLREVVKSVVLNFKAQSKFDIKYFENTENLGHGGNFKECISKATGNFIMFMGDDDMFIPNELEGFIKFVKNNLQFGYFLRCSRQIIGPGKYEYFKYYSEKKVFQSGEKAFVELFLKSVFMSGFTIKRSLVSHIKTTLIDHTLLFQLYLLAHVTLKHSSIYYDIPFIQGVGDGTSFFGTNQKERSHYEPGKLVTNNLRFIEGFLEVTKLVDQEFDLNTTTKIRKELSKYSYPLLSFTRNEGLFQFLSHTLKLRNKGLATSIYFYIYFFALLFLGSNLCNAIVRGIKNKLGRRPSL
jgi:abequosyltransferase